MKMTGPVGSQFSKIRSIGSFDMLGSLGDLRNFRLSFPDKKSADVRSRSGFCQDSREETVSGFRIFVSGLAAGDGPTKACSKKASGYCWAVNDEISRPPA